MNVVLLTGRLVKDPEIRLTQNQKSVANFTLAVDRSYKDQNGEKPTDFLNCIAWGNTATFMETYVKKGAKIAVMGSVQVRKWQDRDGNTRYSTDINCEKLEILEFPKRERNDEGSEATKSEAPKKVRKEKPQSTAGSGYEVYSPPGFDELDDDGELPF